MGTVRSARPADPVGGAQNQRYSPGMHLMLTLLRNGRIHSATDPEATALAFVDDTISWIGGEHAVGLAGEPYLVVDLAGALVVPGFVDAHVHCTDAGLSLTGLDLSRTTSLAECLALIGRFAATTDAGVVWGHGWDETRWPESRPPTRAEVDAAVGGRPAYLARVDVHSAAVSSTLAATVDGGPELDGWRPDLPMTREAHHAARSRAKALLGETARAAAQQAFLNRCAQRGIVEVHECAAADDQGRDDLLGLLTLDSPISVLGYLGAAVDDPEMAVDLLAQTGAVALGGDLVVDGALGSRTASLRAPYADAPDLHGARYLDDAAIVDHLVACAVAGVQPGFHAIGDDGVGAVGAALVAAADRLGPGGAAMLAGVTPRVEHAEMPEPATIAAFASTGTVASVQPLFDAFWGGPDGMYVQRLGAERATPMNPFAAFAAAGVTLAFGSDAPVTPAEPWQALRAAVYHRTTGSGISARAALLAHTRGGHRAARRTVRGAGTLSIGAPAQFAVVSAGELVRPAADPAVQRWSTDPRSRVPLLPDLSPDAELPTTLCTVVDGRVVHDVGLFGP
jgi:predicted amidohydrolase YtcJ